MSFKPLKGTGTTITRAVDVPRTEIGVLDCAKVAHLSADLEVESEVDGQEDERHQAAPPAQEGGNANESDNNNERSIDVFSEPRTLTCDAW